MEKLTIEDVEVLFGEDDNTEVEWDGDNAIQGLQIIAKYIDPQKKNLIVAAEHDVIYSVEGEELLEAGITKEDLVKLRKLNWSYDTDIQQFQCFV